MHKKLLALLLSFIFPTVSALAQYYPPSGGGGGGSGTVTSVSVVSANGLAGTVANNTSTPAITLSTSITGVLKGNGTSISAATAGTDYQAPITLTTTGTSGAATFSGGTLNIPQYTGGGGSVSLTAGNTGITLSPSTITGTGTISLGNPTASTLGGIESLTAVTSKWINAISTSGVPSATQPAFTDISGSATLAQFPTIANNTVLGNVVGSTAVPVALTATQLTTIPNVFTSSLQGMVPSSGGGTTNFLRADGSWAAAGSGGGVSSFTGDSIVLSNSASTGAVTATLASAAAYTGLGNFTGTSAAPTYSFLPLAGFATLSGNNTLTANSPSVIYASTSGATITLPVASTCIGKIFIIYADAGPSTTLTIGAQGSDGIYYSSTLHGTTAAVQGMTSFMAVATASATWSQLFQGSPILQGQSFSGGVSYGGGFAGINFTATPTAGQLLQGGSGGAAPTFTSTPGSGTALTSVTAVHQIAGGTAPTIAAGAGAGGTPTITIASASGGAAHDTDFLVTLTSGTIPTGTNAVIFTVTFGTAFASAPCIQVTPANAGAATLMTALLAPYATSTATTMVLNSGTTGLAAATSYSWYVHCSQ